jgi:hypothetical protein
MTPQIARKALLIRTARIYTTPPVILRSRYTCCACIITTPSPNRARTADTSTLVSTRTHPSYPAPPRRLRPRQFSTTNNPPLLKISSKNLPPRPKPPPEDEIEESFLKGSGPGGQKIVRSPSPHLIPFPSLCLHDKTLHFFPQHPLMRNLVFSSRTKRTRPSSSNTSLPALSSSPKLPGPGVRTVPLPASCWPIS